MGFHTGGGDYGLSSTLRSFEKASPRIMLFACSVYVLLCIPAAPLRPISHEPALVKFFRDCGVCDSKLTLWRRCPPMLHPPSDVVSLG